ncbi:methionyl-tRNA formyltransferase [Stomatohabitans albus]|uniref:methionyl-tRNA formyltransferase n=1 Tax=Stomatohabitans albus TaxID=3110766 RepID=UPI00300C8555
MRIAFFGTPDPAVPSLSAFIDDSDIDVAAVITNPDRPAGRGHRLTPPPVKIAALDAGLPVFQPDQPSQIRQELIAMRLDAAAVVAYGSILKPDILESSGHGFVNLHFSLLPAWRGAAPVAFGIAHGDTVGGVTCFRLDAGMDTGDILTQLPIQIDPDETAGALTERLAILGAPELVRAVRGLVNGAITPQPQAHDLATYAAKISSEDARIDWTLPAAVIHNRVRAYNPLPGAHTSIQGARLKVHATRLTTGSGQPGHILREDKGFPVVACGEGAVTLVTVQPAGKPRMAGDAWANGYQPDRLGD